MKFVPNACKTGIFLEVINYQIVLILNGKYKSIFGSLKIVFDKQFAPSFLQVS